MIGSSSLSICIALSILLALVLPLSAHAEDYDSKLKELEEKRKEIKERVSELHKKKKMESAVKFLFEFGGRLSGENKFQGSSGLAIDDNGYLYVANLQENKIQKFDPRGQTLLEFGGYCRVSLPTQSCVDQDADGPLEPGDGLFFQPRSVAVDDEGNIYVADYANHRIQKFDSEGNFLLKIGAFGLEQGELAFISGIAVNQYGNLYVIEEDRNRVQVFDSVERFLFEFGSDDFEKNKLVKTSTIAADDSGRVYVGSDEHINVYDSEGEFLLKIGNEKCILPEDSRCVDPDEEGPLELGDGQFSEIGAIAIDSGGNIYATDRLNGRVQVFDSDGNFLLKFGEPGTGYGQFGSFLNGIAIYGDDTLYVSGYNRIQVFQVNELPEPQLEEDSDYIPAEPKQELDPVVQRLLNISNKTIDPLHQIRDPDLRMGIDRVNRLFEESSSKEINPFFDILSIRWMPLERKAFNPGPSDHVLEIKNEVEKMGDALELTLIISKKYEFMVNNFLNPQIVEYWYDLHEEVAHANSMHQIVNVLNEYDSKFDQIESRKGLLQDYHFVYSKLKNRAETYLDYESVHDVDTMLNVIENEIKKERGQYPNPPSYSSINSMLAKTEPMLLRIQAKSDTYSQEHFNEKLDRILKKASSIEGLIHSSIAGNIFLPGFVDFADSMKMKIGEARDVLIFQKDLMSADKLLTEALAEWQEVTDAYKKDPYGSEVGYSISELKKIRYRQIVDKLAGLSFVFHNPSAEPFFAEFLVLKDKLKNSIEYGNFSDLRKNLREMISALENPALTSNSIVFDVSYNDDGDGLWKLEGAVSKYDSKRGRLFFTVYDLQGNDDIYNTLELIDTKKGHFSAKWKVPSKPGFYALKLEHQNSTAIRIIDTSSIDFTLTQSEIENAEIATRYQTLEDFIKTFGGENYEKQKRKFDIIMDRIKEPLSKNEGKEGEKYLGTLEKMIFRYLPERSRTAIVDTSLVADEIVVAGAFEKALPNGDKEELKISLFNQDGEVVDEIKILDDGFGFFEATLSEPVLPGLYVAQLQHNDKQVTDIFKIE